MFLDWKGFISINIFFKNNWGRQLGKVILLNCNTNDLGQMVFTISWKCWWGGCLLIYPLYVEDIKTRKSIESLGMVAHTCDLNSLEMGTVELSLEGQLWVSKTSSPKTKQTKIQLKSESWETGCTLEGVSSPHPSPAPWLSWLGAVAHQVLQQQQKVAKDVIARLGKDQNQNQN